MLCLLAILPLIVKATTDPPQPQYDHEYLAGVRGDLNIRLSTDVVWTPRLYRAGRIRIRPQGWDCGSVGSMTMSTAVQPACAGSVCEGPLGGVHADTGRAVWIGVRIARPGVYQLCWCEPQTWCAGPEAGFLGTGCCKDDRNFSVPMGVIRVNGPIQLFLEPSLGEPMLLDVHGVGVTRSSNVLLRFQSLPGETQDWHLAGGQCGGIRSSTEKAASDVVVRYERGFDDSVQRATFTARVFRHFRYVICWCPGENHDMSMYKDCSTDEAFTGEIGYIKTFGPETESLSAIKAIVGAPFSLSLYGDRLGTGDRLRIIDSSKSCGDEGAKISLNVARSYCKTAYECQRSPAWNWPPSSLSVVGEKLQETWYPVVVVSPGLYNLCWCVDNTYDAEKLESQGLCGADHQFRVTVGTLLLEGIDDTQVFNCEAFVPCTIRVASHRAMSMNDAIFLAAKGSNTHVFCGSGMRGILASASSFDNGVADEDGRLDAHALFDVLPHAGPAGIFQICYCQSEAMGTCDDANDFGQPAGKLYIAAPPENQPMHREETKYCHYGRACLVTIVGMWASQLNGLDAFRAVPNHYKCGQGPEGATSEIFPFVSRTTLATGEWLAVFSHAAAFKQPPGNFRLCYCSVSLVPGINGRCEQWKHFTQDTGDLYVLGVKPPKMGLHRFYCSQGSDCNITAPGWHFGSGDRLLLLADQDLPCGEKYGAGELTEGFENNPAANPVITIDYLGERIEFAFGRANGAGTSRVCFCSKKTSWGDCVSIEEFAQDVGTLEVFGAITAVSSLDSQPSTSLVISVVAYASFNGRVSCAVTASALPEPPNIWDLTHCMTKVPSCVGFGQLPWRASTGANVIHVPISNFSWSSSASALLPEVHAWCAADYANCPGGSCAMPPTGTGLLIPVKQGLVTWREWRAVSKEPFNFSVTGDPLNTLGYLEVFNYGDDCGCQCGPGAIAFSVGSPSSSQRLLSASWINVVIEKPGRYLLCWCDRGYGSDCAMWHQAGLVAVAGPTSERKQLPLANPGQRFSFNITGVDLRLVGHLAVMLGDGCEGPFASMNVSAPREVIGDTASWDLVAPLSPGNFTLCWGEQSKFITPVADFHVIESKDCVLSTWNSSLCSRPCGNGILEERRYIVAWPEGGGQQCPSEADLFRKVPCNTQPCPKATVFTSWTEPDLLRPGDRFRVVLTGENFAPFEDRVMLLSGDAPCGDSMNYRTGGTCQAPTSTSTRLLCGSEGHSLRVSEEGIYRICFCDASHSASWQNGTEVQCGDPSAFALAAENGSQVHIIGPPVADFELEEEPLRQGVISGQQDSSQATGDDRLVTLLSVIITAVFFSVAICVWWCWVQPRCKRKEKAKPKKVLDTKDIVRQATREVWNAYARSVVEGVDDEEVRQASHAILDANAEEEIAEARKFGRQPSMSRLALEDGNDMAAIEDNLDSSTSASDVPLRLPTPPTRGSTGETRGTTPPSARGKTPPSVRGMTPPSARGSTASTRGATPPSAMTPGSRCRTPPTPSFFQVPLSTQPETASAPKEGGSFLDMPLLGVANPPRAATPPTVGASSVPISRPSSSSVGQSRPTSSSCLSSSAGDGTASQNYKQATLSGSSWWSSSYASSMSDTSDSSGSPRDDLSSGPPLAPRGVLRAGLPNLVPLELQAPAPLEDSRHDTPPANPSTEALTLESGPAPVSPTGAATLSSSQARPPGLSEGIPCPPNSLPPGVHPPGQMQHVPEAPSQPPPEQLLDVMGLRPAYTSPRFVTKVGSLPPPPPPPDHLLAPPIKSARSAKTEAHVLAPKLEGKVSEMKLDLPAPPPPLLAPNMGMPAAPSMPPPPLPPRLSDSSDNERIDRQSSSGDDAPTRTNSKASGEDSNRQSQTEIFAKSETSLVEPSPSMLGNPVDESFHLSKVPELSAEPPELGASIAAERASGHHSKGWSFTSMIGGMRLPRPWASSSRNPNGRGSGRVSATPPEGYNQSLSSVLEENDVRKGSHCSAKEPDLEGSVGRLPIQEPLRHLQNSSEDNTCGGPAAESEDNGSVHAMEPHFENGAGIQPATAQVQEAAIAEEPSNEAAALVANLPEKFDSMPKPAASFVASLPKTLSMTPESEVVPVAVQGAASSFIASLSKTAEAEPQAKPASQAASFIASLAKSTSAVSVADPATSSASSFIASLSGGTPAATPVAGDASISSLSKPSSEDVPSKTVVTEPVETPTISAAATESVNATPQSGTEPYEKDLKTVLESQRQNSGVETARTYIVKWDEVDVFVSCEEDDLLRTLRKGDIVEAAGPPRNVDGYAMLPIKPKGAVELEGLQLQAQRDRPGTASSRASSATNTTATTANKVAPMQGKYTPGPASSRVSTARSSTYQRHRPNELDNVGEQWNGPRWTGRERGPEDEIQAAGGVRPEVLAAQEKIRQDWHNRLAAEVKWDELPSPQSTLKPPPSHDRDLGREGRLAPSFAFVTSSTKPSRQGSAATSQASSVCHSPRSSLGPGPPLPGPPLPGGPGPPMSGHGSPQAMQGGSLLPGPPPMASKGPSLPGPPLGRGPPLGGSPNAHARGAGLGGRPPTWAFVAP